MDKLPQSIVCSDPSVIKPLLSDIRKAWDAEGVEWALLSGWEHLPEYVRHDIDIIISPKSYRTAVAILKKYAEINEWRSIGVFKEGDEYSSFYFVKYIAALNENAYIQFDLFKSFRRHNVVVIDVQSALAQRRKASNGFWHVPVGWRGAFLIIKEMLARGRVEGQLRHVQIKESVISERTVFCDTLRDFGGMGLMEKTITAINGGDMELIALASEYLMAYKVHVLKSPFAFFTGILKYIGGCLCPFKRLFVAFIGPDGCGKTTIADAIESRFYKHPFANVWRVKSGFGPLPRVRNIIASIKRIFTGKNLEFIKDPEAGTKGSGMVRPHSTYKAMLYVAYYGLNQFFGWVHFLRFSPSLPSLIIADRYYYDYYYQLAYCKCPKWFIRFWSLFIPKPDMLFVLEREADEIYEKKPELDVSEIRREQEEISRYLSGWSMTHVVNSRSGVAPTVRQVEAIIGDWLLDQNRCK